MRFHLAVVVLMAISSSGCDWGRAKPDIPSPPPDLPSVAAGTPVTTVTSAIVLTVARADVDTHARREAADDGRADSTPSPDPELDDWRISLGPDKEFTLNGKGRDELRAELIRLQSLDQEKRPLLIRAPRRAPTGAIHAAFEIATHADITRAFLAVVDAAGSEQAMSAARSIKPLPEIDPQTGALLDTAPCRDVAETRVLMAWNSAHGRLERLFGQHPLPEGIDGDALLERLLRDARAEDSAMSKTLPVILDCGPSVPWQNVVDVVALAYRTGWPMVAFPVGAHDGEEEIPSAIAPSIKPFDDGK
jgi:hypothetical protein